MTYAGLSSGDCKERGCTKVFYSCTLYVFVYCATLNSEKTNNEVGVIEPVFSQPLQPFCNRSACKACCACVQNIFVVEGSR